VKNGSGGGGLVLPSRIYGNQGVARLKRVLLGCKETSAAGPPWGVPERRLGRGIKQLPCHLGKKVQKGGIRSVRTDLKKKVKRGSKKGSKVNSKQTGYPAGKRKKKLQQIFGWTSSLKNDTAPPPGHHAGQDSAKRNTKVPGMGCAFRQATSDHSNVNAGSGKNIRPLHRWGKRPSVSQRHLQEEEAD